MIDSPQIKRLKKEHKDEIEEDAMDLVFLLFGDMFHIMFERSAEKEIPAPTETSAS